MELLLLKKVSSRVPIAKTSYFTVLKKENDYDNTIFGYYFLYNGNHTFKKRLNKNSVYWLLRSGRFFFLDYYDTDGEFIESMKKHAYAVITECTILFRYNL